MPGRVGQTAVAGGQAGQGRGAYLDAMKSLAENLLKGGVVILGGWVLAAGIMTLLPGLALMLA